MKQKYSLTILSSVLYSKFGQDSGETVWSKLLELFIYSADVCKSVSPIMLCQHTLYQKQAQVPSVPTLFWFPNFLGLPTNGSKPDHIHLVILSWLIIVDNDGGGESGEVKANVY